METNLPYLPPGSPTQYGFAGIAGFMALITEALGELKFISVPPGAEIFIDGVDQVTRTPCTVMDIPEGSHTYRLVLAGYKDLSDIFTMEPEKISMISAELEPVPSPLNYALPAAAALGILGIILILRRK